MSDGKHDEATGTPESKTTGAPVEPGAAFNSRETPERTRRPQPSPDKLIAISVRDRVTQRGVLGEPVRLYATLKNGKKQFLNSSVTNRAGYLSFRIPQETRSAAMSYEVVTNDGYSRTVEPNVDSVTLEADANPDRVDEGPGTATPDNADWNNSPESYVRSPEIVFGDLPCADRVHNTDAPTEFSFFQLTRRPWPPKSRDDIPRPFSQFAKPGTSAINILTPPADPGAAISFGDLLEYRQQWIHQGHSLGRIVYSLPLAPCETVNMAVIDWARTTTGVRDEATHTREELIHDLRRDRSIEETVESALSEYQGGGSSVVAGAVAAGGSGAGPGAGAGAGVLAGGIANSESIGLRNLTAETVQNLADSVSQASGSMRSRNSTVIVQSSQTEHEVVQTRTVRNLNQNHALTIQYYEVLRHFDVVTKLARVTPVVLIPFFPITFTRAVAIRFANILGRTALDPRVAEWIRSAESLGILYATEPDTEPVVTAAPAKVLRYHLEITTGAIETTNPVQVFLVLTDNSELLLQTIGEQSPFVPRLKKNDTYSAYIRELRLQVDPSRIDHVRVEYTKRALNFGDWSFAGIQLRISPTTTSALWYTLLDTSGTPDTPDLKYFDTNGTWDSATIELDTDQRDELAALEAEAQSDNPDKYAALHADADRLLRHLNDNRYFYSRQIFLQQDPGERVEMLFSDPLLADSGLLDEIEFTPLGVFGARVAFPYLGRRAPQRKDSLRNEDLDVSTSRHVALPSRGVFAEAALSNCNAREKRDPSRMYDASEMCLNESPRIADVQTGSRFAPEDLSPSAMPAPVVNIQNAPAAPDPVGLSAALSVMQSPNIFRDMSLGSELMGLVDNLASGTMGMVQAQRSAQSIKRDALTRGIGGSAIGTTGISTPHRTPREVNDLLEIGRNLDGLANTPRGKQLFEDIVRSSMPHSVTLPREDEGSGLLANVGSVIQDDLTGLPFDPRIDHHNEFMILLAGMDDAFFQPLNVSQQQALNWKFDDWVDLIQNYYVYCRDHLTSTQQWMPLNELHKSINRFYVSLRVGYYLNEVDFRAYGGLDDLVIPRSEAIGLDGRSSSIWFHMAGLYAYGEFANTPISAGPTPWDIDGGLLEIEIGLADESEQFLKNILRQMQLGGNSAKFASDSYIRLMARWERTKIDYVRVATALAPGSSKRQEFLDALNSAEGYELLKDSAPKMLYLGQCARLYLVLVKLMVRKLELIGDRAYRADQFGALPPFFKVLWTSGQIKDILTLL